MSKPNRHATHILDSKAKKYLEAQIPDEWFYNIPSNDYGLDYQVEICVNKQVTGLNFSIQLKGHEKGNHKDYATAVLKHSTISYYKVRLEPIMIVVYYDDSKTAYWSWLNDLEIDLSKGRKEYTVKVPKLNVLVELDWDNVIGHVQTVFNNRTFISDLDISKIHDNVELAAWKAYHDANYEQAVFLFRQLVAQGSDSFNVCQALSWSLFQIYQYPEALTLINQLIAHRDDDNIRQSKACILAEYGISTMDKGKILQARELFKKSLNDQASNFVHYNYANALSALGEYGEAVAQYRASLQKDSNFAQCWKNLGTAQGETGDHQSEIKSYEIALSINPELIEALFSMGIALAKDFQKHKEALTYFERAFPLFKTTRLNYINGLYWVAECYKQSGDVDAAFYWLNYGLNFQGNNLFLLNFKTSLLAETWPSHQEYRKEAEDFFYYRIELSHHALSIYHLIELKDWTLAEAFPILKAHHPIFHPVSLDILSAFGFDLEMAKVTLLNFDLLASYKQEHRVTRFMNDLINDLYSIGPEFYNLIDLLSAYVFNCYISNYQQTGSEVEPSGHVLDLLTIYVPKLVPYLVETDKVFSEEEKDAALYFIYNGLETVVFREIGALSGFINFQLGLRKVDPSEYITDDRYALLQYNLLVAINDFLPSPMSDDEVQTAS